VSSAYVPSVGDLVGIKRIGAKGIVLEAREMHISEKLFGVRSGMATVLVDGARREYGWSDIYQIPTDEDEDDGPEVA
jgi:hypothetical protein